MTFTGEIREVDDVPEAFADLVAERRPPSIALSGGSTADASYRALAARGMDWANTDVYLGDERFVVGELNRDPVQYAGNGPRLALHRDSSNKASAW